jgi:hypothetical protein
MDLAGDSNTQEDFCQGSATLVVEPTGAAFSLTKTVQGNLDPAPKDALQIGDASGGGAGTGTYVLTWSNVGSDTLDDPVIYDILPYVGDTGVSQGQQDVMRDSQFAPVFSTLGTLPTGVTAFYSQSTNPCREQVYPDSANTGCDPTWSTISPTDLPGDLSDVKALEFIDGTTDQYLQGSSFAVSFTVTVPSGDVNEVAWNSAATNASDVSNPGTVPLPAEPPKVGLTAPTGPSLSTTTSTASLTAYSTTAINDSVTVLGTGGNSGTLAWSLVGPASTVAGGCTGADWTGAATVASGSITTPAEDGVVTVGPAEVQGQGCYSWTESLTLRARAGEPLHDDDDDLGPAVVQHHERRQPGEGLHHAAPVWSRDGQRCPHVGHHFLGAVRACPTPLRHARELYRHRLDQLHEPDCLRDADGDGRRDLYDTVHQPHDLGVGGGLLHLHR